MHTTTEAAKKSTLEAGTVVMVTTRGKDRDPNGMGLNSPWTNAWTPEMDYYVGKTLVVAERPEGLFACEGIAFENCPFTFPSNVLVVLSAESAN